VTKVVLRQETYERLIEQHTTPTERLMYRDVGKRRPDGLVEYELREDAAEALRSVMLPGEDYSDTIERCLAITGRQVS
jgi:hypothetical protein